MTLYRTFSFFIMLSLVSLPLTKGMHFLSIEMRGSSMCSAKRVNEMQAKGENCKVCQDSQEADNSHSESCCGSSCNGNAPCCLSFAGCLENITVIQPDIQKNNIYTVNCERHRSGYSRDIFQPPKAV
jgi:hypothetical protein